MKKKISVIVSCYNEEESLPLFYKEMNKVMEEMANNEFELVFVNDGSNDKTLDVIKSLREKDTRIRYVSFSRNFGKEAAMLAGLDYATGDYITLMDADLQDPPELIIDMLKYYEEGYDDVYAKRKSRKGETVLKKFTSHTFYRVLRSVSKVPIQEDTGDFRLLSRRAVEALKAFPERQRYTKGMFSLIGFKKKAIEFDRDPRVAGTTKWNYFKLFDLAIEGITSFTVAPLRIATILGTISAIGALIYMVFIFFKTIINGVDVPGYASLICIMLLLGGIQLISLGIIGEYLGRIFIEVKNRPLYFVDEYSESKYEE